MAKRKHQSAYHKATDALEQEGRKECFKLTGINVADSVTKAREKSA